MSASYQVEPKNRCGVTVFELRGPDSVAIVVPEWGGNCFAFEVDGFPVLEDVPFEVVRDKPTSFGMPILFPFPNRIRDGRFSFGGKQFVVNPARHGFVRDKPWKDIKSGGDSENGAWVSASIDSRDFEEKILNQFGFPFRLRVEYRLASRGLSVEFQIENLGDSAMPFGLGLHPYFHRPRSMSLLIPARERWSLDSGFLPTGSRVRASEDYDFTTARDPGELELDDIYTDLIPDSRGTVTSVIFDRDASREVHLSFKGGEFSNLVVYTPPSPRRAICVEPYTCPSDAFNLSPDSVPPESITLGPGENRRFVFKIDVKSPDENRQTEA